MSKLEDLIAANKKFYISNKSLGGRKLLTFLASKDSYATSLTMKFAMACADLNEASINFNEP